MASEPLTHRESRAGPLRSIGRGHSSGLETLPSVTVDPDTSDPSEGMPEWLVTNGLGGYASGTITGVVTRRFHGYLIAALPAPRGRTMMLNPDRESVWPSLSDIIPPSIELLYAGRRFRGLRTRRAIGPDSYETA